MNFYELLTKEEQCFATLMINMGTKKYLIIFIRSFSTASQLNEIDQENGSIPFLILKNDRHCFIHPILKGVVIWFDNVGRHVRTNRIIKFEVI